MHSIAITTECVADVPNELLEKYNVGIIYFDVETEKGLFRDNDEIVAGNIIEYMNGGERMAHSVIPTANDYKNFFMKQLKDYDEVIHISIASKTSHSLENAMLGRAKMGLMGKKVYIIDSTHLSSGQGLVALEAARLRNTGINAPDIVNRVNSLIPRVCTSFITDNADYLYYNGRVTRTVMQMCKALRVHPVLATRNGELKLIKVYFGNYRKALGRYINKTVKQAGAIDTKMGFITYVGCNHELLEWVREKVLLQVPFEELWEQHASCTISCNAGPLTVGVLFIQKEEKK